jgi:hypothetical protein
LRRLGVVALVVDTAYMHLRKCDRIWEDLGAVLFGATRCYGMLSIFSEQIRDFSFAILTICPAALFLPGSQDIAHFLLWRLYAIVVIETICSYKS